MKEKPHSRLPWRHEEGLERGSVGAAEPEEDVGVASRLQDESYP